MDPIMSPTFEVKEEIIDTNNESNETDIVKNEIEIKTEAKEFLSCCNKGEEECYMLHPAPKPHLNMDTIMSPMFEVKEETTVTDNEIDIITKNEIWIKTEDAADCIDYNSCCYCNEEFASAEIRDKHEVQCHMGPQHFQDADISNCSEDGSQEMISQSSKQEGLHQQLHLHLKATKCELGTYSTENPVLKISPSDGERAEDHYKDNYKCNQCDYETRYSRNLKRHELIHDSEGIYKKYKCELCAYKTHFSSNLKHHEFTHDIDGTRKKYKCELCAYRTHLSGHLERHKSTHEIHKNYKCDQCDYETHVSRNLKRHKLIHDVEGTYKKHKCGLCAYETRYSTNLKLHKLTHDPDGSHEKYECELCDYKTHRNDDLKKHKLRHDVDESHKKYKCELCAYKTHFSGRLKQHKLTHDVDRTHKYRCDQCDYKTHRKYYFNRHTLKHTKNS